MRERAAGVGRPSGRTTTAPTPARPRRAPAPGTRAAAWWVSWGRKKGITGVRQHAKPRWAVWDSTSWPPAIGGPIALLELGASAGLNLLYDRYRYRYGDHTVGDAASPVTLDCELRGMAPPRAILPIAWRGGVDLHPVDVTDDDAVEWLQAC